MQPRPIDTVVIVGGGVAGLSAGVFVARHGLETTVLDAGDSILRRNAHLENVPGFPAGVDARRFLELLGDQAERAGCSIRRATVTRLDPTADGLAVETAAGDRHGADAVVAATKNATDYLDHLAGVTIRDRGKTFVETDDRGRTGVEGLYVAGRLAGKPHQTVVAAGHGAEVAVTLLEDADRPFYHDWVVPEGYFTDRGVDVPPGCEEIDDDERRRRARESRATMREYFAEPYPDSPDTHPRLRDRE
jgi:thioredoxin reductase